MYYYSNPNELHKDGRRADRHQGWAGDRLPQRNRRPVGGTLLRMLLQEAQRRERGQRDA